MEGSERKIKSCTSYPECLLGHNLLVDGYIRGGGFTSTIEDLVDPFHYEFLSEKRQSDHDDLIHPTTFAPRQRKATFQLKEYNSQYNGLTIIPWEDFAFNPGQLNDLFHLEKTGFITFDPEEVNVFFHATRMNKPAFGEISENGGAWVLTVENTYQLETIRLSLTEKLSVFGLTLVQKGTRFKKKQRAPCLLMIDPNDGILGDQINAQIMQCSKIMDAQRKFYLEISFNGSVERWCRKVTGNKCISVGAKLIVTNGDEPENLRKMENILCCVACFPVWAIQTVIIKLHRKITYEDISLEFNAEEILLHGSVGGIQNQRQHLFRELSLNTVFYTKQIQNPNEDLGYKYICFKKYDKNNFHGFEKKPNDKNQYETTSIYRCFGNKPRSFSSSTDKSEEISTITNYKRREQNTSKFVVDNVHNNQVSTIATEQQYLTESDSTKEQKQNINITEVESIARINVVHSNLSEEEFSSSDHEMSLSSESEFYQNQGKEGSKIGGKESHAIMGIEEVHDILFAKSDETSNVSKVDRNNKCESIQENSEISELESESLTETVLNANYHLKNPIKNHARRRRNPRYDSKRKYLSVHTSKLKTS